MTINERFELIIQSLFNGNKRAFAKAVGISPTVVENIVGARKGKPSYDVLEKVCANANISAEWLLFGSGEDLISKVFNVRRDLILSATPGDDPDNEEKAITTVFTKSKEHTAHQPNQDMSPLILDRLLNTIAEKDAIIREQAEELGRLREQIEQFNKGRGHSASDANTSEIANVG